MTQKNRIDLNADLGESDDAAAIARDRAMMTYISSCNIASGGHAGNERTMRTMLVAAKQAGVAAGVHPSYPDKANFGRRSMHMAPRDLRHAIVAQIRTLATFAAEESAILSHVKPHGALYNDAADDAALALLIAECVADTLPGTRLFGLAGSKMEGAAREAGLDFTGEGFADRRYTPAGRLQPRGEDGAVIDAQEERLAQALALAGAGTLTDCEGNALRLSAETICIHSDSDAALNGARLLRRGLEHEGIVIGPPQ